MIVGIVIEIFIVTKSKGTRYKILKGSHFVIYFKINKYARTDT